MAASTDYRATPSEVQAFSTMDYRRNNLPSVKGILPWARRKLESSFHKLSPNSKDISTRRPQPRLPGQEYSSSVTRDEEQNFGDATPKSVSESSPSLQSNHTGMQGLSHNKLPTTDADGQADQMRTTSTSKLNKSQTSARTPVKLKVYKHLQAPEIVQNRYTDLKDLLEQKLILTLFENRTPDRPIVWQLWMLGESESSVKPFIVITCGPSAAKKARKFFSQPMVKEECYHDDLPPELHLDVVVYEKAALFLGSQSSDNSSLAVFRNGNAAVPESSTGLPICDQAGRESTIGGLVQIVVDGETVIYGLTCGHHLFEGLSVAEDIHNEDTDDECETPDFTLDLDLEDDADHKPPSNVDLKEPLGNVILSSYVDGMQNFPNLDWALLRFDDPKACPPNFKDFIPPGKGKTIENKPWPGNGLSMPVEIYAGRSKVSQGYLSQQSAFFLVPGSTKFIQTWVIHLNKQKRLLKGDSGAWVVDEYGHVWGHVIASGVLNEVFAVPMRDILDSIKRHIGALRVSIPSESQVLHWHEATRQVARAPKETPSRKRRDRDMSALLGTAWMDDTASTMVSMKTSLSQEELTLHDDRLSKFDDYEESVWSAFDGQSKTSGNDWDGSLRGSDGGRRRISSIFDWSEERLDDSPRSSPILRPRGSLSKLIDENRGLEHENLSKGRIARSQSVPPIPPTNDRNKINTHKFGTWGVGTKGVTEDWNDDFDFDEDKTGSQVEQHVHRGQSTEILVPQPILEKQALVVSHIGLLRELGLLVEELKELRTRASYFEWPTLAASELWKLVDTMIGLVDQETEEPILPSRFSPEDIQSQEFDQFMDYTMEDLLLSKTPTKAYTPREKSHQSSIPSPSNDAFYDSLSTKYLSSKTTAAATGSYPIDFETRVKSVINAIQRRAHSSTDKGTAGTTFKSNAVSIDTRTLRHLVPYVLGLVQKAKLQIRDAEKEESSIREEIRLLSVDTPDSKRPRPAKTQTNIKYSSSNEALRPRLWIS